MTSKEFGVFCKTHKAEILCPTDFGVRVYFSTGEYVSIGSDYDGATFTHQFEECLGGSMGIFNDLNSLMPQIYNKMVEKYGNNIFLLTQEILGGFK